MDGYLFSEQQGNTPQQDRGGARSVEVLHIIAVSGASAVLPVPASIQCMGRLHNVAATPAAAFYTVTTQAGQLALANKKRTGFLTVLIRRAVPPDNTSLPRCYQPALQGL